MMVRLIKTVKELNEKDKRCVYVLIAGSEMFASTIKSDVDDYLKSDASLITPYTDIGDVSILFGFVMNIKELPYELTAEAKKGKHLWLIIEQGDEIACESFDADDIESVTDTIESFIDMDPTMDISNFAIVLGKEMDLVMTIGASGTHIGESVVYD